MRGATLIVLAWNAWPTTRRCLDSLLASDLDAAQVIVVDNGSVDHTPQGLTAYSGNLRVVTLPDNQGFVRGMNAGIAAARADDDVVLLNNDLEFNQKDWLNRLRDAAYANAETGIVGCRLLGGEGDDRVYHLGGFIEPDMLWGQQTESGMLENEVAQFTRSRRVQSIAFALAYIRRDCLQRVGLLDEMFHSYYEDTDYCLRAADAGIACVVAGNVTLRHAQHGSTRDDSGFRERLRQQSKAAFAGRWRTRLQQNYRGDVLWQGVTRRSYAHAQLARELVWRLDARDLRLSYCGAVPELLDAQDFRLQLAAQRTMPVQPDVSLACIPTELSVSPQGKFRVALGFCEWNRATPQWAEQCRALDLLLVPDAFQRQAFQSAGVDIPVGILPLGVEQNRAHPDVPGIRNPHGNFVFLAFAESLQRDAPDLLIRAFRHAFVADAPVELVMRICPGLEQASIHLCLQEILSETHGARVRIFSDMNFAACERMQLMCSADCYVSARRGAGWDPLAAEAVACGRLLIAPAWGSQQALVERYGHTVEHSLRPVPELGPDHQWAEPDIDSLIQQMRSVHERRETLLAEARTNARQFAQDNNLDGTANALLEYLTSGGTLKPARPHPMPHRPADLGKPASGQIVVLGMHRSGTSSIGGLLKLLGAWPGQDAQLLRGEDNPRGHFEHGDLHMACARRLERAGGDWRHPPSDAPAHAVDAFRREASAILDTLDGKRPWFIKEPRLCLLARELLPLLTRPVFVHVVRDPAAVAASLARRDGMSMDEALALWEHYTREAFAASAGWQRVIVDYDALVADPLTITRTLHRALEALGITGLLLPADEVIQDWIEPSCRALGSPPMALSESQSNLLASIRNGKILS